VASEVTNKQAEIVQMMNKLKLINLKPNKPYLKSHSTSQNRLKKTAKTQHNNTKSTLSFSFIIHFVLQASISFLSIKDNDDYLKFQCHKRDYMLLNSFNRRQQFKKSTTNNTKNSINNKIIINNLTIIIKYLFSFQFLLKNDYSDELTLKELCNSNSNNNNSGSLLEHSTISSLYHHLLISILLLLECFLFRSSNRHFNNLNCTHNNIKLIILIKCKFLKILVLLKFEKTFVV
jgi:hypothetical protein